jgi:hypothetical protein
MKTLPRDLPLYRRTPEGIAGYLHALCAHPLTGPIQVASASARGSFIVQFEGRSGRQIKRKIPDQRQAILRALLQRGAKVVDLAVTRAAR